MFKRSERKIKVVFKMQFQATQVPQLKAKSLMVSLVPVDVGKPTVRLPKAPITEGTCIWENPVYETVKLVMETKTGRIREKFYYVIVSTGSSKAGFLGEVSIDFADLAEATKPLNLILPLQTSKSGAILHVTVQKMQGGPDSRCEEDGQASGNESYNQNLDTEAKDSYSFRKTDARYSESDDLSEVIYLQDEQNGSLEETDQTKMLERKAELSELEVLSLRKQIIKETKRGQQLSEQIVCLKEERDALKTECEQYKSSLTHKNEEMASSHVKKETESSRSSLENIKQELQREKQLNKKLKLQLQKTEDSNSEFVLAMRDLSKRLDQKNTEISQLSNKIEEFRSGSEALAISRRTKTNQNEQSKAPGDLSSNHGNADEAEMLTQKIESLYSEIEVHKKEKAEIQMEVERLTQDIESLETENEHMHSNLEEIKKEKIEIQENYMESVATVKQFRQRVANLEAENKRQALQYSQSLNMIDDLEFQVESLQKELEKQAQVFEEDLEAVTEAKVQHEQRAIQAEEALRKTRQSNATVVQKLEEEFKQISEDMSLKIEENEKLAQKAIAEADDLHRKNDALEELLRKAKEELQLISDQYEGMLQERSEQNETIAGINKNSKEGEQKTIVTDESEQMQANEEPEIIQRWMLEKDDLERQLASARQEAEKLMQENVSMKSQINRKKTKEESLQLEVKKLRLKNNEVKNHLLELELENEGLKKDMFNLQSGLRKTDQGLEKDAIPNYVTSVVKERIEEAGINMETNCNQSVVTDNLDQETMEAKDINGSVLEGRNNKSKNIKGLETRGLEELSALKSSQSGGSCDVSSSLSEISSLKERNKSMEEELKQMHERYSEISLRFAEVEGERQQLVMTLRNLKSGKKN